MTDKSKFLDLLESSKTNEAIVLAESSKEDKELFLAAVGDHFLHSGDLESAKKFYVSSMSFKANPAAHFGMGEVFLKAGMLKESLPFFLKSAEKEPYRIKSLLKIGIAERLLGNIKASLSSYLLARKLGYDKFIVDVNIAILLSDLGEHDKAEFYYESALAKAPQEEKVRFNYSLHLLSRGKFSRGFELYESRPWCFKAFGSEWKGDPGRMVLVMSEQGHGDNINFSRFIHEVSKVSEGVCVACDKNMSRLMLSLDGVDEVVGLDEMELASERYPFYCRIMSIPHIMSLDVRSVPFKPIPVDGERRKFWSGLMGGDEVLKVGLCWQGGKRNNSEMIFNDRKRSIDLKVMEPILNVDGARFYSLQKDWKEPHPKIIDLMGECGDFLDAASFASEMDLVISVDTAMAHVAGSVGTPVWMLSRLGGCWRWGNEGSETFWYPSMRIYRQGVMDDWTEVVDDVKRDLALLLRKE